MLRDARLHAPETACARLGEMCRPELDDPGLDLMAGRFPKRGFCTTGAYLPMEAILWHGGEAAAARDGTLRLSVAARRDLMAFILSL